MSENNADSAGEIGADAAPLALTPELEAPAAMALPLS